MRAQGAHVGEPPGPGPGLGHGTNTTQPQTLELPFSLMSTQPLLQRTANKRIALPVRVEPKVAFANERTFLSWLHFTVILGGLAVGLLNFGDKVSSHIDAAKPVFV